jgi:hypothetical protein
MSTTKETAETVRTQEAAAAGAAEASAGDERARARAYLDLWERHLSHAAVKGSAAPGRPPA